MFDGFMWAFSSVYAMMEFILVVDAGAAVEPTSYGHRYTEYKH